MHSHGQFHSIVPVDFSTDYPFGLVGSSGLEPPTSRLSGVRSNHLSYEPTSGGDEEVRTPDPLRARQVLSQLSYDPLFCGGFFVYSSLSSLARSVTYWRMLPLSLASTPRLNKKSLQKILPRFFTLQNLCVLLF